jgi:YD repeat-containing protein
VIYPDGTTETYTYDKNNRVKVLTNAKADKTIISSYQYTYDCAGNQLTKTEAKGTTTYTYDSLNRLSSVAEPEGKVTTYTYDGAGNRKTEQIRSELAETNTVYNYDSRNRLISTVSTGGAYIRYIYDNNGNLVSRTSGIMEPINTGADLTLADLPNFGLTIKRAAVAGTGTGDITLYSYDNYNRLTGTKSGNTAASYRYNAQGYRVEKTVNSKTTRYLYEGDKVVLETDADNRQTASMAYGTNLLYRTVAADGVAAAQSYYYLYNAHGDVTSLIDTKGNIAATYDYDAFGNILSVTGAANNSIRYAGYRYDEESGLYYLNAR